MNAFELYLDGKRLADLNNIHERNYRYATVDLEAGKLYPIRLDYHEFVGDADIRLVWSRPAAGQPGRSAGGFTPRARPMPWCWCWAFPRAWKARR